jgi:hypothetical protein
MTPTVAIVILNYNGRHYLEKFLPGVLIHSRGYEIWAKIDKVDKLWSSNNSMSMRGKLLTRGRISICKQPHLKLNYFSRVSWSRRRS